MQIDKMNNELAFNEEFHKYWNVKYPDRSYTSVTTLIGKYHEQFDDEFWSRYKALQKFVGEEYFDGPMKKSGKRGPSSATKLELLDKKRFDYKWLEKYNIDRKEFEDEAFGIRVSYIKAAEEACDRGNIHHNRKENHWYTKPIFDVSHLIPVEPSAKFMCEKHNFDLQRDKAVLPEFLVYFSDATGTLHLAGQIDLLIKDGNDIYILDYKTNAKGMKDKAYFDFKKKKTTRMYYPINNIDDHMLNHYTLQLSIYAFMLQKINPDFNIKLLRLLHIDGEGVETDYDVPYLKTDVERLLKHYRKELQIADFREENKKLL